MPSAAEFLDAPEQKQKASDFLDTPPEQDVLGLNSGTTDPRGMVIRAQRPDETLHVDIGRLADLFLKPGSEHQTPLVPQGVADIATGLVTRPARWAGSLLETITGKPYSKVEQGMEKAVSNLISGTTLEGVVQMATIPFTPTAEAFALKTINDLPEQFGHIKDTVKEHGLFSAEAGQAFSEAGINDVMGFLGLKSKAVITPRLSKALKPNETVPETAPTEVGRTGTGEVLGEGVRPAEQVTEPTVVEKPASAETNAAPLSDELVKSYIEGNSEGSFADTVEFLVQSGVSDEQIIRNTRDSHPNFGPAELKAFKEKRDVEQPISGGEKVGEGIPSAISQIQERNAPSPTKLEEDVAKFAEEQKQKEQNAQSIQENGKSNAEGVRQEAGNQGSSGNVEQTAQGDRTDRRTGTAVNEVQKEVPPAQASEQASGEAPVSEQAQTTGVANRVLAEEAKAGKIDEIAFGEGMTWQEMVDLGREQLNKGADPMEVARRFKRNQRISPTDFAVLRAERERLAVESNKAAQAMKDNPSDSTQQALADARKAETDFVRDVVQPVKTSTSDIFRGMQGEAPIDASTFEGLRRGVVDTLGREPTRAEAAKLEQRASKVQKAQATETKATENLSKAIDRTLPKSRVPTLEELKSEMEKMAEELTPCKI